MTRSTAEIPSEWRERVPCISATSWAGLKRVLEHPAAPRYNRSIGDRVGEAELIALEEYRRAIREQPLEHQHRPSATMCDWLESLREQLLWLRGLPRGFDFRRDFVELPTTSRQDIARQLEQLVPLDADLEPALVYSTSGTTGHPVIIPSHAAAMVKNLAHLEWLATLHGVPAAPSAGETFMLNVSAQQRTYVFATSMSGLAGAVFAKINLALHDWAGGAAARHEFIHDFSAQWVASEPLTMAEMIRLELPFRPGMLVSSAVNLSPALAEQAARELGSKVVDLYSSTETGPIAATVPNHAGYHLVLVPDLYVEVLDEHDLPLPDGQVGEITVTGGRNPYLPLIRYRTGDYGSLGSVALADGRHARAIGGLQGRSPVRFEALDGTRISSVDVARAIRPVAPFVQQRLVQRKDRSIELSLRPLPGVPISRAGMEHELRALFGQDARISVTIDEQLGQEGGKLVPWQSELS